MRVIDNNSSDGTVEKLRELAKDNKFLKVIVNARNFGHIRSPFFGILQSKSDATIYMASDLQDPPDLIPKFIEHWEKGYKMALGVKPVSSENKIMFALRKFYYFLLGKISEVEVIPNATGFGIYDKDVIDSLRTINDPTPYMRGIICEFGYSYKTVEYAQPRRLRGITKNNWYTLYDIAMLGIVGHSKVPLRAAVLVGFLLGISSMFIGFIYLVLKLTYWYEFPAGNAPIVIGFFFLFGLQLFFMGLMGEYIVSIQSYVKKRPMVIVKERINFEE